MLSSIPNHSIIMRSTTKILINAPRDAIFQMTSDIMRWPAYLPHYRYVQLLENKGDIKVIKMAAKRGQIPIAWTSEFRVDYDNREIHFTHLKAFTKGMKVVWTYTPVEGGTEVEILHELRFRITPIALPVEWIIQHVFIEYVAGKTLRQFKYLLEKST